MTIEEKIFAALNAGSPPPLRSYPDIIPQYPTYPLATYIIVGGEDDVHLDGEGGTARRLVQVDVWARTRLGAAQTMGIAKGLMFATDDFTIGAVSVSGAPTYESDTELYRASLEFSVHYEI